MSKNPSEQHKLLKEFELAKCDVTFWVVKRIRKRDGMNYMTLRVDLDAALKRRFRSYANEQLQSRKFDLQEYAFTNADTDDVLLTINTDATDFPKIRQAIDAGFENAHVRKYSELLDSWAYIVQYECTDVTFFAWRKINALTQPKRVFSRKALCFQNAMLKDLDDSEIFMIDPRFDFFVIDDVIFIANKRDFESSMNFKQGMINHGEELLKNLEALSFLSDVALIRKHVGENYFHLRKLASIRNAGYYLQPNYVAQLMRVNEQERWGLKTDGSIIVVEEATIDLLLKLLNNDRLRSPINHELFDSAAKTAVRLRQ